MGVKYQRLNGESMKAFQERCRLSEEAERLPMRPVNRYKRKRGDYNEYEATHAIGDYEMNGPSRDMEY